MGSQEQSRGTDGRAQTHTPTPERTAGVVCDAAYARDVLPITDVARHLGLEPGGRRLRCPIDRSHWATVWLRRNKAKCFHCRHSPWTTIDLVMELLQLDVRGALDWIDARFDIPKRRVRVTTNRHGLTRHVYVDYPAMPQPGRLQPSVPLLRRAPGWAALTHGARLVAAFVIEASGELPVISTTYRHIQHQTGIGDRTTIKDALGQLAAIGLVQVSRELTDRDGRGRFGCRTVLRLTWGSEVFQGWLARGGRATATKYIGRISDQVSSANRHEIRPGEVAEGERKACAR
jgi:hypothetical protein